MASRNGGSAVQQEAEAREIMPKISNPDKYYGDPVDLKRFLFQCDVYMNVRDREFDEEENKVLWLVGHLKGAAADWAEPYIRDYIDNDETDRSLETRTFMGDFAACRQALTSMFGDPNEERRATIEIKTLRQEKSVVPYAAKFQSLAAKTGWDDKATMDQYYEGLKDNVKDQLAMQTNRPITLRELITASQDIDFRIQERAMERKGHYQPKWGQGRNQQEKPKPAKGAWPQPMEIDAITRKRTPYKQARKEASTGKSETKRPDNRKPGVTCYNCGKVGHYKRDCRGPAKSISTMKTGRGGYNGEARRTLSMARTEHEAQLHEDLQQAMMASRSEEEYRRMEGLILKNFNLEEEMRCKEREDEARIEIAVQVCNDPTVRGEIDEEIKGRMQSWEMVEDSRKGDTIEEVEQIKEAMEKSLETAYEKQQKDSETTWDWVITDSGDSDKEYDGLTEADELELSKMADRAMNLSPRKRQKMTKQEKMGRKKELLREMHEQQTKWAQDPDPFGAQRSKREGTPSPEIRDPQKEKKKTPLCLTHQAIQYPEGKDWPKERDDDLYGENWSKLRKGLANVAAMSHPEHGALNYTSCYGHYCRYHQVSKDQGNWHVKRRTPIWREIGREIPELSLNY